MRAPKATKLAVQRLIISVETNALIISWHAKSHAHPQVPIFLAHDTHDCAKTLRRRPIFSRSLGASALRSSKIGNPCQEKNARHCMRSQVDAECGSEVLRQGERVRPSLATSTCEVHCEISTDIRAFGFLLRSACHVDLHNKRSNLARGCGSSHLASPFS